MKSSKHLKCVPLIAFIFACSVMNAVAQQSVSGIVTDAQTGDPLPGVNILVVGTTTGAATDNKGHYSVKVSSLQDTLRFSYIGYQTKTVPINRRTEIDVVLQPTIYSGNQLVVVGYGTEKKGTITGSISTVQGKKISSVPVANVSNTFAGRIPGVIANNRSGEPGYDGSSILIRGQSTLNNNSPLIVVNGVPAALGGLDRIDPDNIKSISVLKGESAAIYGARAANGVILVTTKHGQPSEVQVTYHFNEGFSMPTRLPKMANSATYAQIRNEIKYYQNPDGGLNQLFSKNEIKKFRNGSDPLNYPNTNWLAAALRLYAPQNRQNLTISGGSEKVQYYTSLGYLYQGSIYNDGVTHYNQYNIRSNVRVNATKNLMFGASINAREEKRDFPQSSAANIFRGALRAFPTVNTRYPNGKPSYGIEGNNPVIAATDAGGVNRNPQYIFDGKINASYELPWVKGLSINGFLAGDKSFNFMKSFSTPYVLYQHPRNSDSFTPIVIGATEASLYESQTNTSLITENLRLELDRSFYGVNHIKAFVGYEQSIRKQQFFSANRMHFPTPLTPDLSQGGTKPTDATNAGNSSKETHRDFIGRARYTFKDRYIAEFQFRYDGSSIFPEGHRYGFFPGGSIGWRVSSEPWFSNNIIDNLKIRASYGELGNDRVDPFQYYSTYAFQNRYVIGQSTVPGVKLAKIANPNITWEVSRKLDIGINATFLNKLDIKATVFKEKRDNILTFRSNSVPALSGIVNAYNQPALLPAENIGKVNNKGIEGKIRYHSSIGSNARFYIGGNMTYAKNKIIYMDEAPGTLPYQSKTGRPIGSRLLYKAIGIFKNEKELSAYPHVAGAQPGDLKYLDYNKDGKITADDRVRVPTTDIPQIQYGINLGGSWRNFSLAILFEGQARVSQYILPEVGTIGNAPIYWSKNRWTPNHKNGTYPRITDRSSNAISGGGFSSTFWLRNSAFLRLKNLKLSYQISPKVLPGINWDGATVYVSGFNLFTITPAKGFDPEGSSGNGEFYPQQKIYNIGFKLKF
jgi:TonB-linked SusC/RagA family outer membrane protein